MRTNKFYEMRICKDEFNPLRFNDSFSIQTVENLDRKTTINLEHIILSHDEVLSDWNERPSFNDVQNRLNSISKCYLFYHKNFDEAIGWGWFSNVFTYDWVNEVHPLPTENSVYYGGTYIRKELKLPLGTGIQMYNFAYRMFFETYDYIYGYMDGWNKSPIKICHKLGTKQIDFIKDYKR